MPPRQPQQILEQQIGALFIQIASLQAQLEAKDAEIAALKAGPAPIVVGQG